MITLTDISKSFHGIEIFKNINCHIGANEIVALTGSSGSGKTTLLRIIAGTLKPDSGNVVLISKNIGFIFQDHRLLPWKTSLENIELVLRAAGMSRDDSRRKARNWLDKVGLGQYAGYYPSQLSGGMIQRVSIARAFAIEPEIILMDEPFSNLDTALKYSLLLMVKKVLMEYNVAAVYVTHDMTEALQLADRLLELGPEGLRETTITDREVMLRNNFEAQVKAMTQFTGNMPTL